MAANTKPAPFKLLYLLLGSLITNIGASFIWPLTTVYIHDYLHKPLTTAGIVIFLNCFASLIGNIVGGRLFDNWRPVATLLSGITITSSCCALLVVAHGWPVYAVLLMLNGLGSGIINTAINGFATQVPGKSASLVFNYLYFTSALGVVFGTLFVGIVLKLGIGRIFTVASAMYILFLVLVLLFYRQHQFNRDATASRKTRKHIRLQWPMLMVLLTVFTVWVFYEQWDSNVSTYMIDKGLSFQTYSTVWTVNAIVIIVVQPFLTRLDAFFDRHLHGRLYAGLLLLAVSFPVLAHAQQYLSFVLAMILLSLGEVFSLPAVSTYVDRLAPVQQRGSYQGFVQAAGSAGRAFGPLLGALLIERASYQLLFYLAFVMLLGVTVIFAASNRRQQH
jgi:MFS family permease